MFECLEDKKLGATIVYSSEEIVLQRIAIAFTDDANFCASGGEYEKYRRLQIAA